MREETRTRIPLLLAMLLGVVCLMGSTGCENGGTKSGLTISPSEAKLAADGDTVTFTVVGGTNALSLPLTWSITKPELGRFMGASGLKAVYQRTAAGANIVTARDQYGSEGIASVNQNSSGGTGGGEYSLNVVGTPSNQIPNGQNTVTITATGAPSGVTYTWSVEDVTLGDFVASSSSSTVQYRSKKPGKNTVTATDSNGVSGHVTIEQL